MKSTAKTNKSVKPVSVADDSCKRCVFFSRVCVGVDTVNGDPEAAPLAGFCLHRADYDEMGELIRGLEVSPPPTLTHT